VPKKRFSGEPIVILLHQSEVLMSQGEAAPVACREAGISQQRASLRASEPKIFYSLKEAQNRHRAVAQSIQLDPPPTHRSDTGRPHRKHPQARYPN
jgi:hypothetical protein